MQINLSVVVQRFCGMFNANMQLKILFVYLVWFVWYYLTLPGSVVMSKNDNSSKPTLKVAFKKYILYTLPNILLFLYLVWLCRNSNK
jgi:hypothetical protein